MHGDVPTHMGMSSGALDVDWEMSGPPTTARMSLSHCPLTCGTSLHLQHASHMQDDMPTPLGMFPDTLDTSQEPPGQPKPLGHHPAMPNLWHIPCPQHTSHTPDKVPTSLGMSPDTLYAGRAAPRLAETTGTLPSHSPIPSCVSLPHCASLQLPCASSMHEGIPPCSGMPHRTLEAVLEMAHVQCVSTSRQLYPLWPHSYWLGACPYAPHSHKPRNHEGACPCMSQPCHMCHPHRT